MISSPKPPPAPDPVATAKAAQESNVNTAIATGTMGNTNQVTPYGNLTYTQAPSGVNVGGIDVPQWTATQTLSPSQQSLFDLGNQTQQNIGKIGVDQSKRIGDLLGTPVDLSPGAVDQHLTQLGLARLEPQLQRDWQQRESDLMNRGIMPGSEGYTREQDAFNRSKNDAYNQLILGGYGQGQQSILAQRNQPINEITALLSGSQVSQPNFVNSAQPNVAPVDVGSIYNNAYANQLQAYGIQQSGQNALLGGLAGLGGAALGGWGMSGFKKPGIFA